MDVEAAGPPAPASVSVSLLKDGSGVKIGWTPSGPWSQQIMNYQVVRSTDGINFRMIDNVSGRTFSISDHGVFKGIVYHYSVIAIDKNGAISGLGGVASILFDSDTDGDGTIDAYDDDDDGDGIPDLYDANPLLPDKKKWDRSKMGPINVSKFGTCFIGENELDYAGIVVSDAGDVNGDGYDDFLISAVGNDQAHNLSGKVYLFFGKKDGHSGRIDMDKADASFIGEGEQIGCSLASAGDLNGDGYDDILIGEAYNGANGIYSGAVHVVFGKPSGWSRDVKISDAEGACFIGESETDMVGYSVSGGGDINGDGYPDIVIGGVGANETRNPNDNLLWGGEGKVYIVFGGRTNWTKDFNLTNADASYKGEYVSDQAGNSISSKGDVNGDGYADILIGSVGYDPQADPYVNQGKVYLVLGRSSNWHRNVNLSQANASFYSPIAYSVGQSVTSDGDLNGDGYSDILFSSWSDSQGKRVHSGTNYLFLGKASGWKRDTNVSSADAFIQGEKTEDSFGYPVDYVGDVNNDGHSDLMCSAHNNNRYCSEFGKTYLFYGEPTGWSGNISVTSADLKLWGEDNGDVFGLSVSTAGDIDRDGSDEFLVSAPLDMTGPNFGPGKVHLFDKSKPIGGGTGPAPQEMTALPSDIDVVEDLKASLVSGNKAGIKVGWKDSVDDPYIYGIYRGYDAHTFYRIAQTNTSTYTDNDVVPGLTYYYAVTIVDPLDGESEFPLPVNLIADADTDGDGLGNLMDLDSDGDGVPNGQDAFPLNALEWLDTDLDGTGNNADQDDDNDGIKDIQDPDPLNPLNNIVSSLSVIDTRIIILAKDLDDLWMDLLVMDHNLTLLQNDVNSIEAGIAYTLDSISKDISNLSLYLIGMNATMRKMEDSLLMRIDQLDDGMQVLYQNVMDDISTLSAEVTISYLSLMDQLIEVNASIGSELSAIDVGMTQFRSSMDDDLRGLMDAIEGSNESMAEAFDLLNSTVTDLNDLTLGELTSRLDEVKGEVISSNETLSAKDIALLDMIEAANVSVMDLRSEMTLHLVNISKDLEELDVIETNVTSIRGELDTRSDAIDAEVAQLDGIVAELSGLRDGQQDADSKLDDISQRETILLVICILAILMIIIATLLIYFKKGGSATEGSDGAEEATPPSNPKEGPATARASAGQDDPVPEVDLETMEEIPQMQEIPIEEK